MIRSAAVARKPGPQADGAYALGYSDDEFRRLERQGDYYRDLTKDVLVRAGMGPGMRVLDVGCGVGDVALIAAGLVGQGEVVGVDRSPEAMATAARRVEEAGRDGVVRFAAADLATYAPEPVIGRFILMYMPDPAATLRRYAGCLRPGGVVAFHEMAMGPARSVPEGPLFRESMRWIMETFVRAGFETRHGRQAVARVPRRRAAGAGDDRRRAGRGRDRRLRLRLHRADAAQPAAGGRAGGVGDAGGDGARDAGRTAPGRGLDEGPGLMGGQERIASPARAARVVADAGLREFLAGFREGTRRS